MEHEEEWRQLFSQARARTGKTIQQVSAETRVSTNFIGRMESEGPFRGLWARELLRLVKYYGLDLHRVISLLGVELGEEVQPGAEVGSLVNAITALPQVDREWLVEVVDTLLRGMRVG